MAKVIGITPDTLRRVINGKQICSKLVAYCITKFLSEDAEIADYFDVSVPTIKGILYTNNIKVTDIRPALTSSRRIKITNIETNESKSFRKKFLFRTVRFIS